MIGVAGKLKLDADGDVWFQCEDGNFKVAWPDEGCNIFRQLQEVFEHHAKNAVFKAAPKSKASGLFGEIPPMDEGKPLPKCLKCGISITLRPHGVLCPPCAQKDVKIYREGAEKSIEEYERSVEEYERRKTKKAETGPTCHDCHKSITELPYEREDFETREKLRVCEECAFKRDDVLFGSLAEWVEVPLVRKCIKCGKPLTQHQIDRYLRWCDACEDECLSAGTVRLIDAAEAIEKAKKEKRSAQRKKARKKKAGKPAKKKARKSKKAKKAKRKKSKKKGGKKR